MIRDPQIERFASGRALGKQLRADIETAGSARAALIALAVGSSTLPHYAELDPSAPGLAAKTFLAIDELVPQPARAQASFSQQLRHALPSQFGDALYAIRVKEPARACEELEARVKSDGIAICVLGLGPDGHIAFNQPESSAETRTRLVEILPENLARLGNVAPATHALTLGVANLLAAERIVLVADGAGKERALERILEGPEGSDVPASFLRRHPNCRVLVSEDTRDLP